MRLKSILVWLVAAAALTGLRSSAGSAESWPGPLPPEAQQAFERGMAAAKQEAWDVAAKYFEETQKTAPVAPSALFNLGLAHAHAGHELAAIAWLRAYLAVSPSAENATAVHTEIERLKAAARSNVAKIFQAAAEAARQLPDEAAQSVALTLVSASQARTGDIAGAQATVQPDATEDDERSYLRALYGKTLAEAGDLAGARQILNQLTEPDDQDTVLGAMRETLFWPKKRSRCWMIHRTVPSSC